MVLVRLNTVSDRVAWTERRSNKENEKIVRVSFLAVMKTIRLKTSDILGARCHVYGGSGFDLLQGGKIRKKFLTLGCKMVF